MREDDGRWTVRAWLRELIGAPVYHTATYFDRLTDAVASSAPVRTGCSQ